MTRRSLTVALTLLLLASSGCAYYNGLYNAEHLVKRAEKAEREGRTGEASGYWGEAGVKADTVLARFPHSKWADRARIISGKARAKSGDCEGAVVPLRKVAKDAKDAALADEAAVLLSGCLVKLGQLEEAGFAVERLTGSPDPAVRSEAGLRAGAAYRRSGRSEEAIALLKGSDHPQARGELAAALADAGRIPESLALADTLASLKDTTAPWGAILAAIGREDIANASTLLDRIRRELVLPPDSIATWLNADAVRWFPADGSIALRRLDESFVTASGTPAGGDALMMTVRFRLAHAEDFSILDSVPVILDQMEPSAGDAVGQARFLLQVTSRMRERYDSLHLEAPQGDMRAFLLGEALRDSLRADRLAIQIWNRLVNERPESPYAPKAVLVLATLAPVRRDSLIALLRTRYPESPYLIAAGGGDSPGFQVLEDSLARYSRTLRSTHPAGRTPRPTTPARPVQ
jgi:tetratricopeptide (TPR) repeat protein